MNRSQTFRKRISASVIRPPTPGTAGCIQGKHDQDIFDASDGYPTQRQAIADSGDAFDRCGDPERSQIIERACYDLNSDRHAIRIKTYRHRKSR